MRSAKRLSCVVLIFGVVVCVCIPAAAGPMSPSTSNLVFWVDGSSLSANGQTWTDLSGNGNNATASSGSAPTLIGNGIGGQPTAAFNGTAFLSINSTLLASQDFTIIAVASDTSLSLSNSLRDIISNWDYSTTVSSIFLGTVASTPGGRFTDDIGGAICCGNSGTGTVPNPTTGFVLTGQVNNGQGSLFADGILIGSNSVSTRDETQTFVIGRQGTLNGEYWVGDISEILVYSGSISASQLNQDNLYLSQKYGISVANTVPEPSALLLLSLGICGVVCAQKFRRTAVGSVGERGIW